jgi:hypothetical protein
MISVTQFAEALRQILEEEANELAKETGFLQRERIITGADASPNTYLRLVRGTRDPLRRLDADRQAARSGDHREWLAPAFYTRSRRLCGATVGAAHAGALGSGGGPGRAAQAI